MRLDIVLPNEGEYGVEAMETGPYYEAMGWQGIWLSDHLLGIVERRNARHAQQCVKFAGARLCRRGATPEWRDGHHDGAG